MTEGYIVELMRMTLLTVALISAPVLATIVIVGLTTSILQTVTQLRDQSLTFVPKVIGVGVVILLAMPWYIQVLRQYVETIFTLIASVSR